MTEPPNHLSERSRRLWRELVPRRASSPERLQFLLVALECLDEADRAREVLLCEGLTVTNERTGIVHAHPLTRVEKDARCQFLAAWRALGLNFDPQTGPMVDLFASTGC